MIGSYWGAIGAAEFKRIQTKSTTDLTGTNISYRG
jgi:hypothetical protein